MAYRSLWFWVPLILGGLGAVGVGWYSIRCWGTDILEFRSDGLALGNSPQRLRLIPWNDILFARAQVVSESVNEQSYGPVTMGVRIRLRDGSRIRLQGSYDHRFKELDELIDPPPEKVVLALGYMAAGDDVETAAEKAGLPGRVKD